MGEAEIVVLKDAQAVARESARRLMALLDAAVARRGEAHLALTGGSSAVTLYEVLAQPEWRDALDWSDVHLWWGDDRFVPVDHPESNVGLAYRLLLGIGAHAAESGSGAAGTDVAVGDAPGLPVDIEKVHPFEIDEALSESDAAALVAQRYAEEMEDCLPRDEDGMPAFDVILLGVGGDGHILSVFPDSAALEPDAPAVLEIPAPQHIEPHLPRLTLNPRLLSAAGLVLVMVSGAGKAEILRSILHGKREPRRLPAQLADRANAVWLLDEAAATLL